MEASAAWRSSGSARRCCAPAGGEPRPPRTLDDLADAEALAACNNLQGLRGLDLRANQIGWRGFRAIAAGLRSLRWVEFGANCFDDPCSDDAPPEARGALALELGPLPWLSDPLRRADGGAPFVEQLDR